MTREEFLNIISQLESSGGRNVAHSQVQSGLQAGTTAAGQYALMPNTVDELVNRRAIKGQFGPDENILSSSTPEEQKQVIETQPRIEQNLAGDLAGLSMARSATPEEAAYRWRFGHNLQQINPEDLEQSGYVQKFKKLKDMLGQNNE